MSSKAWSGGSCSRDVDGSHIDWTTSSSTGKVLISDANGLTINGGGSNDVITLDYTNGYPLPALVHLNGTFTLNGLPYRETLAGTTLDIGRSNVYFPWVGDQNF